MADKSVESATPCRKAVTEAACRARPEKEKLMKSYPFVRLSWLLAVLAVAACNQSPLTQTPESETVTPQFGTSGYDGGVDVTFDSNGRIYVVGDTDLSSGQDTAFVRRYTRSGGLVWKRQFDNDYGNVSAASAAGDGSIYVAGSTYSELQVGGDFSGGGTGFVRKYSDSGSVLWTQQLVLGVGDTTNQVFGVTGDRSGNIYAVGSSDETAFVRKFSSSGAVLWTRTFASSTARDAVVDQDGYVYIVGGYENNAFIRKYSASGTLIWTRTFSGTGYRGATSVDVYRDAIYLAGDLSSNDAFVRKYSTGGTLIWTQAFGTSKNDSASDVEVDSLGNVYVAGDTNGSLAGSKGSYDAFVRKYSASGTTVWTKQFGSSKYDSASALTTRTGSEVYVVGITNGALAGSYQGNGDAFLRRLNASGDAVWTR